MTTGVRNGLTILGLVAVVVTAWVARAAEGRRDLDACDAALSRGDRGEAIVFARAAAEARCPACAAPELGYARLSAMAKEAEKQGDDAMAVAAWQAVRAALLGTVVIEASSARLDRANAEIARIEHRMAVAAAALTGAVESKATSEERLSAALASRSVPSGVVFVFLATGGILFGVFSWRFVRGLGFRAAELMTALLGAAVAVIGVLLF